jgi:hypothetical protein
MSVQTAALVLAWACLILLAFAMAGLLQQLRDIQARVIELGAQGPQPLTGQRFEALAGGGPGVVLLASPSCALCGPVLEAFVRISERRRDLVFTGVSYGTSPDWPDTTGITMIIDHDLYRDLDVPWSPALLLVDAQGTVMAAHPIDSPSDLDPRIAELLQTRPTTAAGTGS